MRYNVRVNLVVDGPLYQTVAIQQFLERLVREALVGAVTPVPFGALTVAQADVERVAVGSLPPSVQEHAAVVAHGPCGLCEKCLQASEMVAPGYGMTFEEAVQNLGGCQNGWGSPLGY